MIRRPVLAAVLAFTLALLAGCETNYDRPTAGTVIKHWRVVVKVTYWHLGIQQDDGTYRDYLCSRREYLSCQVGDRWPDCAERKAS